MTIRSVLIAAVGFLALETATSAAQGLDQIHDQVRVGRKVCFRDHFHDGSSAGQSSRKAAEIEAIRVWQDFTGWEYGRAWGSFRLAESKGIKCSGGGNSWGCNVTARPCRSR
ncbi:MAG: hypothetical protein R3D44_12945 [Hyphomicrobiaceae bacterium]